MCQRVDVPVAADGRAALGNEACPAGSPDRTQASPVYMQIFPVRPASVVPYKPRMRTR